MILYNPSLFERSNQLEKLFSIIFIILIFSFPLTACSGANGGKERSNRSAADSTEFVSILNAKHLSSENPWIKSVAPEDNSTVDSESAIEIQFKGDMDESTLNSSNIIIQEGKYSRNISDLFDYLYDEKNKKLNILFKLHGNSYGTGDGILVYLKKSIKTKDGKSMDGDYYFSFNT